MSEIYSYHTFILPVILSGTGKAIHSFDQITKCFDQNLYWKITDPKDKNGFSEDEDFRSYYNEYQYFYPQVRNALYGNDGSVVKTYSFAKDKVHEKAHYYITKKDRTYDLLINAIRLKVYNTGVALFIMECENHGKDKFGNSQNTFADVKNINDYGRRISLPYISYSSEYSSCADRLEVSIPDLSGSFVADFKGFIEKVCKSEHPEEFINLNHLCDFVKNIINYGGSYIFTSNHERVNQKNVFQIRLALDDRMFVACLVEDKKKTNKMLFGEESKTKFDSEKDKDGKDTQLFYERQYAYETDEKLSRSLYEFIFVDPDDNCTCQSGSMRKDLLEKHVYKRWLDFGSIYAFAAQSIVLLFNGNAQHLIGSFLTIYERIACLCLVQRASIMEFQKELALLSVQIHDKGNKMRVSTVTRLMDLQERFAAFESQICFTEISSQEQAIDIYEAMTEFFFIDDEMENIKSQLDVLNEAADTYLDFGFNKVGYIFTFVGALYGVLSLGAVESLFPDGMKLGIAWGFIGGSLAATILVWVIIALIYRRRRN